MKKLLNSYSFVPDSGLLYFTGLSGLSLENFLLVTNVTHNKIIYNFADPAAGAQLTGVDGGYNNGLYLDYATSGVMNSGDKLQIFYDVSNERVDTASGCATGYSTGVGFTGTLYTPVFPLDIQSVGGRAVDLAGSGFYPYYKVNDAVSLNFDKDLGGALAVQADLDYQIDSVTNFPVGYSSVSNYSTGLLDPIQATGMAPTVISGNANRISFYGQNMGNTLLYVKFGVGASSSSFSTTLLPGLADMDGRGEKISDDSYKGDISVNVASGQSGIYLFWEGV